MKSNSVYWLQTQISFDAASSLSHWPSNVLLPELAKEVSSSFGLAICVSAFTGISRQIHQGWQEQKDVLFAFSKSVVNKSQFKTQLMMALGN